MRAPLAADPAPRGIDGLAPRGPVDRSLGAFLQRQRETLHPDWSQKRLGEAAGVSNASISRLESGAITRPPMKLLAQVAPWYGCDVLDLWQRCGYLTGQDAAAIAALLAEYAPLALIQFALERGPWPSRLRDVILWQLTAGLERFPGGPD